MPSLHRRHRVLAGGCTEATSRARWAHCPRWAAVSPHSARGAHSCHAARRGISGRFDLSRAVVRRVCRRGHAGALRPLCSAPACPAFSPIAQAHQPHRWGGSGALFGCTGRTCARARCCNVRIGETWPTYGWTRPRYGLCPMRCPAGQYCSNDRPMHMCSTVCRRPITGNYHYR